MINYKLNVGKKEIQLKSNKDLIDLDCYTTKFDSDVDLKIELYQRGAISLRDDYEVFISYDHSGRQTIPVLYKEHLDYINPNNLDLTYAVLYNYIYFNFEDIDFLNKFISFYSYSKYYAQAMMPLRNVRDGFDVTPNEQREIVEDICSLMMKDSKTGRYNYKSMRKLGLFIHRYELIKKLESMKKEMEKPNESLLSHGFKAYEGEQLTLFKKIDC